MEIGRKLIYERTLPLLLEPRDSIVAITGPRQVGKTTLINQLLKNIDLPSLYSKAEESTRLNHLWINQQWQAARLQLTNNKAKEFILVIDEIQRVDNWSEIVKSEWEDDTKNNINLKVVILGSSRLQLQNGLNKSLKGKAKTVYVPHWSYSEMKETFNFTLNQYLWFGGYPGIAKLVKNEKSWKNYLLNNLAESAISKDVFMMGRIDKPALLHRLFELGCSYSGQIVSLTKILRQLQSGGNTTTLANYLKLLDSAGILTGLNKSAINNEKNRASIPKFQVHNNGLTNAFRPIRFKKAQVDPIIWGQVSESAIGAHLVNYSMVEGYQVEYWRERNTEVDFVIKYNDKRIGIDIKNRVMPKTSGTQLFAHNFNPEKIITIGDGGYSIHDFLMKNPIDMFV